MMESSSSQSTTRSSVVLFYKYFLPSDYPLLEDNSRFYEEQISEFLRCICEQLELKGRILVAIEGVNGTLSAPTRELIDQFTSLVENITATRESDHAERGDCNLVDKMQLFTGIDWKHSLSPFEPFPDLKIAITNEIIASGDAVSVAKIKDYGGKHLSPTEFHREIEQNENVVFDRVRNRTFCPTIDSFACSQSGNGYLCLF